MDLERYCLALSTHARAAASELARARGELKDGWLRLVAEGFRKEEAPILEANARDIEAAPRYGLSAAQTDRLKLDRKRLGEMAAALEQIAMLPDPVGEVVEGHVRPNGLEIRKVRVPLGVVLFIYESRPNVTADAAALCVKSGNAVILRGGKEALHSNQAIAAVMRDALVECGLPEHAVQLVETTDREAVGHLLRMKDWIDLVIPRGGKDLIQRVSEEAQMPVLKHFEGNCHVYVDASADVEMAVTILLNAKCQRPAVCNAAESLLVHAARAEAFFREALPRLAEADVELRVCPRTRDIAARALADSPTRRLADSLIPVTEEDYYREYLDLILAVKVVDSLDEAIQHINTYGSHHTDAIVTADLEAARRFTQEVDS
ncbi:MAG: glutamate-5-semialdehyde dehydrogenase, partial [Planctomycetes bacterium]|nr:glutamate-5-semialdehyde dehydrogenase [Planctomycetota bacterium]